MFAHEPAFIVDSAPLGAVLLPAESALDSAIMTLLMARQRDAARNVSWGERRKVRRDKFERSCAAPLKVLPPLLSLSLSLSTGRGISLTLHRVSSILTKKQQLNGTVCNKVKLGQKKINGDT